MIHPTAVIDKNAQLGERVDVGPYAVIDGNVVLGDDCRVGPHTHLTGYTRIGSGTVIHAGAVIGGDPQDVHFDGTVSYARIGSNCTLREYVTINRGADQESSTVLGDNVMMMAFAHLGHDCQVGDHVVIANNCSVAGRVEIGARAFISAAVMIHQFVRIGQIAMLSGGCRITQDVPPFSLVKEDCLQSANAVGMRRAGIGPEARTAIRGAIKQYFFAGLNRPNALKAIRERYPDVAEVEEFAAFIEETKRGIISGRPTVQEG